MTGVRWNSGVPEKANLEYLDLTRKDVVVDVFKYFNNFRHLHPSIKLWKIRGKKHVTHVTVIGDILTLAPNTNYNNFPCLCVSFHDLNYSFEDLKIRYSDEYLLDIASAISPYKIHSYEWINLQVRMKTLCALLEASSSLQELKITRTAFSQRVLGYLTNLLSLSIGLS